MKHILLILALLLPSSIASAKLKTVFGGADSSVPSNMESLAQAANEQIDIELKSRSDYDVISSDALRVAAQSNLSRLTGMDAKTRTLAVAGLAGADYLLRANVSAKDNKLVIDFAIVDVLSSQSEWEDSVYTTDIATPNGIKKAVKAAFERLSLKISGQSVGDYNESSFSQKAGEYEVKVHISDVNNKDDGATYRLEMLPLGEVPLNTNIVIPGKVDYTILLYKNWVKGSNQVVYSNHQYIDDKCDVNVTDQKWGSLFDFRLFTGMGELGIGTDFFFTRKLSIGFSISGSVEWYSHALWGNGSPSGLSLSFVPELTYYFIGDRLYDFRISGGIHYLVSEFEAAYGPGDRYASSETGFGLFLNVEYSIFFFRIIGSYVVQNNDYGVSYPIQSKPPYISLGSVGEYGSSGIYPTIEFGIHL
jgi:hypothetical protein